MTKRDLTCATTATELASGAERLAGIVARRRDECSTDAKAAWRAAGKLLDDARRSLKQAADRLGRL